MKNEGNERLRERILSLIEAESESDAAFEREFGLKEKTVNNWRRGKSSSYMKLLPELSQKFKINVGELMDIPLKKDTSELSEDELALLQLYRKTRTMPEKMRASLRSTLENTITMYATAYSEMKRRERKNRQREKGMRE